MKIKGIKRGQTIELLEQINIPDDTEITIEVELELPFSEEERLTRLNQLFGVWSEESALDEIFTEIDRERHAYRGRVIESLDK